ncbi:hypothetical protein [Methylobacterium trifolii]|uniref:Uncharacterized protein n=1 Tax=Methylobacterium trifolii TaxID=1003092 RepID=A0ABQ4U232_9HYPH|nr:hypothetical protein [Methylobacterium trifolii]GJE61529.1 hypothetical protein MPOCJGCO_3651 [Methylobacterium trifolii]
MTRRVHRDFDALTEAQVVAGRTAARRVTAAGLLPADAPKRITELLDAIDHVAEAATGDRSFLHLKPAPGQAAGPLRARV